MIEPDSLKQRLNNREPVIFAHWHGDELVLVKKIGYYRVATMTSTSKDGQMMNTIVRLFGAKTTWGSSTRGAVGALKGLVKLLRNGYNSSMAVDGPKGPLHKVKPGVFELSKLMQIPIYYAGVAAQNSIEFPKSWNKTYLPKPFSRVVISWHGPMSAVRKDQDPRDESLAHELENNLHTAKQKAAKLIADANTGC